MKKTMIALGAAASMALFANAAATYKSLERGTGFEGLTVGENLNTAKDDLGTGTGALYWYSSAAVDSLIAQDTENTQNATKYLAVDESEPLYRMAGAITDSGTGAAPSLDLVHSNVYFQADVQFTASDATNGTDLVTSGSGDKILVWLQGTEGDGETAGTTNLIITAARGKGEAAWADFAVTNVTIAATKWYNLRIDATTATAGTSTTIAAFNIYIDNEKLLGSADDGATTTDTFYSPIISGTEATTITCAGFKGTGAIDNLNFGTFAEEVVNYFKVGDTEYATFADALAAATTAGNATISLLQNVTLTPGTQTEGLQIDEGDVTLDLAGKVITSDGMTIAIYGGSLTITNSTETVGSVETTDADELACSIYNEATLVIKGGKYLGEVYTEESAGGTMAVYDANGNEASLQLDASGYYVITSGDTPSTFDLTLTGGANAQVTTDPATITGFTTETSVTITAVANEGYTYTDVVSEGWTISTDGTTATYTLTVSAATEVAVPNAVVKVTAIDVPTAVTDLVYDGSVKTGVVSNAGYTLSGTWEATDAGNYTATATLIAGYVWSDSTTDAKVLNWTIAQKEVTPTLTLSVTEATYDSSKTTPGEYATPTVTAQGLTEGTDYSGAWDVTEVTSAGGTFTYTVAPVEGSNYTFTSVTATLTITTGGGSTYPSYIPADNADAKAKYDAWKATYGDDTESANEKAFLLNCAPTEEAVAAANAAFKITSIAKDATSGEWKVETVDGSKYNGTIKIKQYSDVKCTTEDAKGTFFRAILSL